MSINIGNRFGSVFESTFLLVTACLCVILSMLPVDSPFGLSINPSFPLIAIFYWVLYRPDLMSPVSVFIVGLFQDLLSGAPAGFFSFVYLLVYTIVVSQRLLFRDKSFVAIWSGFGVIALLTGFISWIITCLSVGMYLSPAPVVGQAIYSFVFYPPISWVFVVLKKRLLSQI